LIPYLFITFVSPLLGLFLVGWAGVVIEEILALANLVVGLYAVTQVIIETRH